MRVSPKVLGAVADLADAAMDFAAAHAQRAQRKASRDLRSPGGGVALRPPPVPPVPSSDPLVDAAARVVAEGIRAAASSSSRTRATPPAQRARVELVENPPDGVETVNAEIVS